MANILKSFKRFMASRKIHVTCLDARVPSRHAPLMANKEKRRIPLTGAPFLLQGCSTDRVIVGQGARSGCCMTGGGYETRPDENGNSAVGKKKDGVIEIKYP